MDRVAILGLGVMGAAAAGKLVEAGSGLTVYDPAPAAGERAGRLGLALAAGPGQAAEPADLCLMFLPGPAQVADCVAGPQGLLTTARPGTTIVDLSTVDPATTVRLAGLAGAKGVGYLDAPVLGRPGSVGRWALPVGGRAEDLERCRPVLERLAAKIFHLGGPGSGNKVKLLNQLMFSAINGMTAEMMAVAERVGVPPRLLYETISSSQAGTVSNLFLELGRNIAAGDYDHPTFSVDLLCKDVRLAIQMAKEHGAPPLLAGVTQFLNESAQAQGHGAQDTAVMWQAVGRFWTRPD